MVAGQEPPYLAFRVPDPAMLANPLILVAAHVPEKQPAVRQAAVNPGEHYWHVSLAYIEERVAGYGDVECAGRRHELLDAAPVKLDAFEQLRRLLDVDGDDPLEPGFPQEKGIAQVAASEIECGIAPPFVLLA